jgi:hypothetical protein
MAKTRSSKARKPDGLLRGEVSDSAPAAVAKPRARSVQPVKDRISHIVGLMVRGHWVRGETTRELAEEWELDEITVQHHAIEASRFLDLATNDLDQIEKYCRIRLREIAEENGPDRVQAIQVTLKNAGRLMDKQEISLAAVSTPELIRRGLLQALDDPEMRAFLLAELEKRALATEAVRGLLTQGECGLTRRNQGV